jgi:hypothetical protein
MFFYGDNNSYHNFTVPTGVNFINAKLYGAQGGNGNIPEFMHDGEIYRGLPGKGGYIEAYLRVAETQILYKGFQRQTVYQCFADIEKRYPIHFEM